MTPVKAIAMQLCLHVGNAATAKGQEMWASSVKEWWLQTQEQAEKTQL